MKLKRYNPKAREALGKTYIDIGVSIFKGVILLFTVLPITVILKTLFDDKNQPVSLLKLISSMTFGTYILLLIFVTFSMFIGAYFRDEGLKHIHEAEKTKGSKGLL